MAYITMAFETNTNMNHVNKCRSSDLPHGLAWKLLEGLRKWAQSSDLAAMLELRGNLSNVRLKRKDYPDVLSRICGSFDDFST